MPIKTRKTALIEQIPPLPPELWDKIRETSRGHFPAGMQKSDNTDDFERAVRGRKSPVCEKYGDCSAACEDAKTWGAYSGTKMVLDTEQTTLFIQSALLYLFDNAYSVFFRKSENEMMISENEEDSPPTGEFARASLLCQMLVLVGRPYIDEIDCVSDLTAAHADLITEVYYNHTNNTVGVYSGRLMKMVNKNKRVKVVEYRGFVADDPSVELNVALANNTFYWMNDKGVQEKRITENDLTFPVDNFVFESINCTTPRRSMEIQKGDNHVIRRL